MLHHTAKNKQLMSSDAIIAEITVACPFVWIGSNRYEKHNFDGEVYTEKCHAVNRRVVLHPFPNSRLEANNPRM